MVNVSAFHIGSVLNSFIDSYLRQTDLTKFKYTVYDSFLVYFTLSGFFNEYPKTREKPKLRFYMANFRNRASRYLSYQNVMLVVVSFLSRFFSLFVHFLDYSHFSHKREKAIDFPFLIL